LNEDLNVEASEGAYLRVFTLSGAREPDPLLSTATTTSGRTPNTVTVLYRYPEVRRMGEVVNVLVAFAVIVFLFRWVTSSAFVASLLKWPSSDLNLAWNR